MSNANKFTERATVTIAAHQGQERRPENWIRRSGRRTPASANGTAEADGQAVPGVFPGVLEERRGKYGGTGLGLVIAGGSAKMMGGPDITVAKRAGQGARCLPYA